MIREKNELYYNIHLEQREEAWKIMVKGDLREDYCSLVRLAWIGLFDFRHNSISNFARVGNDEFDT